MAAVPQLMKPSKNSLSNPSGVGANVKSLSQRILSGSLPIDPSDLHSLANHMIFELNLLAGKMLILQHQLIELVKLRPRHIVENLRVEWIERTKERFKLSIFRTVHPQMDWSMPP